MTEALQRLGQVASDPVAYVQDWKRRHPGAKAAALMPMNFPEELIHAAGMLPVVLQESAEPDTEGRVILAEFYCGYTRSLADQSAKGSLDVYDAFFSADHCVALLGAVDVIRYHKPDKPHHFGQFIASMSEPSTPDRIRVVLEDIAAQVESCAGEAIDNAKLAEAIRLFNRDRGLLREIFDARRDGRINLSARQIQDLVTSAMVMDKAEHVALLEELLADPPTAGDVTAPIRLHLSGHFCHAPKRELLDLIEECGAQVADDDLYHGRRYITTDVPEDIDPVEALAQWYFDRNVNVPCATRVQHNADWDAYLDKAVHDGGADGVVVLMPKFCEPHMLMYPELKRMMDNRGIPHLLIETEHEGMPMETMRTRLEALIERISRRTPAPA